MYKGRCMCEIIGPGSLSPEDREKYYFPRGRPLIDLELVETIRKGLAKGRKSKVNFVEVDNVH